MFPKTGSYDVNTTDLNSKCKNDKIWTISKVVRDAKPYTYDEALNLTGHGSYNILLLAAGSLSLIGQTMDLFALPAIGSVAACELKIGTFEEKIIMSIPTLGAMVLAYPWGYISDTRGRRLTMLVTTWVSFIVSCLAIFSRHWVVLTVLKFISVSFSSSTQATGYTLVGESCAARVKVPYLFLMTAFFHIVFPIQMALPLAASAICLHFLYESPKYLVNAGKEDEAIKVLAYIWKRNGQRGEKYPVYNIILNEENSVRRRDAPFLESLWNQVVPLFRMPLLLRTLQLFFLIMVTYGCCGGLLGWLPFLADAFISGSQSSQNSTEGLCNMIGQYALLKNTYHESISCVPKSNLTVVWVNCIQGAVLFIVNCSICLLSHRRKALTIATLLIPSIAALGSATLPSNSASLTAYCTIFLSISTTGIVLTYIVDLYPTSHRGMVSCLSIVAARIASIVGINVVGSLIVDHCKVSFSLISATLLCGVIVSCFLPSDKQMKLK